MESTENSWKPHGLALKSYFQGNKDAIISIIMDDGYVTKMPIEIYFRSEVEFPELEKIALNMCKGKTLDVGAGAGAHSLFLQEKGLELTAIDICSEGVDIMQNIGVKSVYCQDFLKFNSETKFDTLLFLMNGIGIVGDLEGLDLYLQHAKKLLESTGQIILDSSDLRNGETELDFSGEYFGIFEYQMQFEQIIGEKYNWLYIDQELLIDKAKQNGYNCEIIYEQEDGSFLARLTLS